MEKIITRTVDIEKAIRESLSAYTTYTVVDIENKDNQQLKNEVYDNLSAIFRRNKHKLAEGMINNDSIETRVAFTLALNTYRLEFRNILKQFYIQIDQLRPLD